MKKQELRLGNLVEYPGWNKDGTKAIFKVRDIFLEGDRISLTNGIIQLPNTSIEVIKPIPLTEEWLVKFGFESNPYQDRYENKSIHIECNKLRGKTELWIERMPHIKYIHQLQNLYWVLCGKELTLKE